MLTTTSTNDWGAIDSSTVVLFFVALTSFTKAKDFYHIKEQIVKIQCFENVADLH